MKLLIASDIHGSAYWCAKLEEAVGKENPDRILLLGDLLYHGPRNDLPQGYSPKETAKILNSWKGRVFCVRGNCEAEVDQMMLDFPVLAEYSVILAENRVIFATHGHHYNIDALPPLSPGDILLYGHTHVPLCRKKDGVLCLNPGSVSLPKNGSGHQYLLLEDGMLMAGDLEKGTLWQKELRGLFAEPEA
ncbi:MAG: phosphodiesterase [Lachnospiraceae bacterium]|jgi:putative phosphoesterase